jgi:hypothetical protein
MDYVCDTNVWYELGQGTKDVAKLKQGVTRLAATGISAIEISTRMTDKDFAVRRSAAKAVVDHADIYLKDPDYHIAEVWGLNVPPLNLDWKDVFQTIATARDMHELNKGVENLRRVDTKAAAVWRDAFSDKFVSQVVDTIRRFYPTYAAGRLTRGGMKYVKRADIEIFEKAVALPRFQKLLVLPTRGRAADLAPAKVFPEPTDSELAVATPKLLPFVKAYLAYLVKVATTFAPSQNDWGDVHCFAYIQDGRKMLTAEKRWLEIASEAGLSDDVIDSRSL